MINKTFALPMLGAAMFSLGACADNYAGEGALGGAAVGAGVAAVTGEGLAESAAIGAAVGAAGGYFLDKDDDCDGYDRDGRLDDDCRE